MKHRRTRKDKIIAQLRRRVQREKTLTLPLPQADRLPETVTPSPDSDRPAPADRVKETWISSFNLGMVRKDLTRTAFLALAAFAVEGVLFWLLR